MKINHIYDCYPLYELLYGSVYSEKALEVESFLYLFEAHQKKYPVFAKGVSFLEQCAGRGEIKQVFDAFTHAGRLPFELVTYHMQDVVVPQGALNFTALSIFDGVPQPTPWNLVWAGFYSVNGCYTSRALIVDWFRHVHTALEKVGGSFYLNFMPDSGRSRLDHCQPMLNQWYPVPTTNALACKHNLGVDAYLQVSGHRCYNRLTGDNEDWYTDVALYSAPGKQVETFTIARPFVFHFWSEAEIVAMLAEAGFEPELITFAYCPMKHDGYNTILKPHTYDETDPTLASTTSANMLLAHVKKSTQRKAAK